MENAELWGASAFEDERPEAERQQEEQLRSLTFDAGAFIREHYTDVTFEELDRVIVPGLSESKEEQEAKLLALTQNQLETFIRCKDSLDAVHDADPELFTGAAMDAVEKIFAEVRDRCLETLQPLFDDTTEIGKLRRVRDIAFRVANVAETPAFIRQQCALAATANRSDRVSGQTTSVVRPPCDFDAASQAFKRAMLFLSTQALMPDSHNATTTSAAGNGNVTPRLEAASGVPSRRGSDGVDGDGEGGASDHEGSATEHGISGAASEQSHHDEEGALAVTPKSFTTQLVTELHAAGVLLLDALYSHLSKAAAAACSFVLVENWLLTMLQVTANVLQLDAWKRQLEAAAAAAAAAAADHTQAEGHRSGAPTRSGSVTDETRSEAPSTAETHTTNMSVPAAAAVVGGTTGAAAALPPAHPVAAYFLELQKHAWDALRPLLTAAVAESARTKPRHGEHWAHTNATTGSFLMLEATVKAESFAAVPGVSFAGNYPTSDAIQYARTVSLGWVDPSHADVLVAAGVDAALIDSADEAGFVKVPTTLNIEGMALAPLFEVATRTAIITPVEDLARAMTAESGTHDPTASLAPIAPSLVAMLLRRVLHEASEFVLRHCGGLHMSVHAHRFDEGNAAQAGAATGGVAGGDTDDATSPGPSGLRFWLRTDGSLLRASVDVMVQHLRRVRQLVVPMLQAAVSSDVHNGFVANADRLFTAAIAAQRGEERPEDAAVLSDVVTATMNHWQELFSAVESTISQLRAALTTLAAGEGDDVASEIVPVQREAESLRTDSQDVLFAAVEALGTHYINSFTRCAEQPLVPRLSRTTVSTSNAVKLVNLLFYVIDVVAGTLLPPLASVSMSPDAIAPTRRLASRAAAPKTPATGTAAVPVEVGLLASTRALRVTGNLHDVVFAMSLCFVDALHAAAADENSGRAIRLCCIGDVIALGDVVVRIVSDHALTPLVWAPVEAIGQAENAAMLPNALKGLKDEFGRVHCARIADVVGLAVGSMARQFASSVSAEMTRVVLLSGFAKSGLDWQHSVGPRAVRTYLIHSMETILDAHKQLALLRQPALRADVVQRLIAHLAAVFLTAVQQTFLVDGWDASVEFGAHSTLLLEVEAEFLLHLVEPCVKANASAGAGPAATYATQLKEFSATLSAVARNIASNTAAAPGKKVGDAGSASSYEADRKRTKEKILSAAKLDARALLDVIVTAATKTTLPPAIVLTAQPTAAKPGAVPFTPVAGPATGPGPGAAVAPTYNAKNAEAIAQRFGAEEAAGTKAAPAARQRRYNKQQAAAAVAAAAVSAGGEAGVAPPAAALRRGSTDHGPRPTPSFVETPLVAVAEPPPAAAPAEKPTRIPRTRKSAATTGASGGPAAETAPVPAPKPARESSPKEPPPPEPKSAATEPKPAAEPVHPPTRTTRVAPTVTATPGGATATSAPATAARFARHRR